MDTYWDMENVWIGPCANLAQLLDGTLQCLGKLSCHPYNMYSPGKESLGILTSISVTAYGAVVHSNQYLPVFDANYIIVTPRVSDGV